MAKVDDKWQKLSDGMDSQSPRTTLSSGHPFETHPSEQRGNTFKQRVNTFKLFANRQHFYTLKVFYLKAKTSIWL